jgi:hypothetical protein
VVLLLQFLKLGSPKAHLGKRTLKSHLALLRYTKSFDVVDETERNKLPRRIAGKKAIDQFCSKRIHRKLKKCKQRVTAEQQAFRRYGYASLSVKLFADLNRLAIEINQDVRKLFQSRPTNSIN